MSQTPRPVTDSPVAGTPQVDERVHPPSATEAKAPEASLSELMGRLGEDLSGLVSAQLDIAKAELKEEASKSAKAAGMLGAGAVAGLLTVLLLSFAAGWGIAEAVDAVWLGFLIVGIIWGAVAAVLASAGKKKLDAVRGPQRTAAELKADRDLAQDIRS